MAFECRSDGRETGCEGNTAKKYCYEHKCYSQGDYRDLVAGEGEESEDECTGDGQGAGNGCSGSTSWCYARKCYSKSGYEEAGGDTDESVRTSLIRADVGDRALTVLGASTRRGADEELEEGEEVSAVFYQNNSDYISDGYYISPVILSTVDLTRVDYLEDGDVSIMFEKFEEDGVTYTLFSAAESIAHPSVSLSED